MTIEPKFSAQAWPAAKVEMWAVENLVPYVRNARQHPPEQIDQIAASMERFGFTIPMLVAEDGTVIAGHRTAHVSMYSALQSHAGRETGRSASLIRGKIRTTARRLPGPPRTQTQAHSQAASPRETGDCSPTQSTLPETGVPEA